MPTLRPFLAIFVLSAIGVGCRPGAGNGAATSPVVTGLAHDSRLCVDLTGRFERTTSRGDTDTLEFRTTSTQGGTTLAVEINDGPPEVYVIDGNLHDRPSSSEMRVQARGACLLNTITLEIRVDGRAAARIEVALKGDTLTETILVLDPEKMGPGARNLSWSYRRSESASRPVQNQGSP